ncbi:hypothetical protein LFL96_25945 [Paraburkholderia sp. D15]|uniref:hypothetical protein n=1 Tax=Paraburkholderia sp. D15 TaxID=2880218 RepID=UPI002478846E|nr:hypothetical protein [Paraburkholderia sp. D15]WGS54459.1 hypothetical protein LFL96_25945 [Paraburkholderia sp. D15]
MKVILFTNLEIRDGQTALVFSCNPEIRKEQAALYNLFQESLERLWKAEEAGNKLDIKLLRAEVSEREKDLSVNSKMYRLQLKEEEKLATQQYNPAIVENLKVRIYKNPIA